MKKIFSILLINLFFLININTTYSQSIKYFTLKEAQEFALENNYDIKNAYTDIQIANKRVKESVSIGFPQINGSLSNSNYFNIATTLLPDFITPVVYQVNENDFGLEPEVPLGDPQFFPAQFGTKYNVTAEVTASQLIFSGSYIVGLQAAKSFLNKSKKQFIKSEIDIKETIAKAYYAVLVTEKNQSILDSTLVDLEKMALETKEIYKIGFVEDTDVDQLDLLVTDMQASILTAENQVDIAYSYLKYYMGLSLNDSIYLTDDLNSLLAEINQTALMTTAFDYNQNIDYIVLENQKNLSHLLLKLEKASYLPTLSAFFNAQTNAMRNDFNFFEGNKPWYPTTFWGIQLDVPIFSSGSRSAKVQQKKLELNKINEEDKKLKAGLTIQANTLRSEFYNALMVYNNKQKSLEIAKKIYKKTEIKYIEGISSSMDLLQAHNQFLTAESDYIKSIFNLLETKLTLEKLLTKN
ncbi:MAG: TolC family protein [Bacteroidales bacterium]|nr:TolC family protein [Bacteroidales bacterium]